MTTPLTPEQRDAIAALADAYESVLRVLYRVPPGVDIAAYVEREDAPDGLRAEWRDFSSPKYDFVRELMAELRP